MAEVHFFRPYINFNANFFTGLCQDDGFMRDPLQSARSGLPAGNSDPSGLDPMGLPTKGSSSAEAQTQRSGEAQFRWTKKTEGLS